MKRTLLVPALLAVATPVAAQYAQPWNGGGITVSAEEQAARAGRVIPLAVAGVALTVSDIDRSRRFYEELLTFRTIGDTTIGGEEWDKLTGIAAGIMQPWFSFGWIWTAIGLLILISMGMFFAGTVHYSKLRKAVGLPYMEKGKPQPAVAPASEAEIVALVRGRSPIIVAVLGAVGLTVILWLMMFKPF